MRKKVVAGNWKMNFSPTEGGKFAEEIGPKLDTDKTEAIFCVPFTDIAAVSQAIAGLNISIGSQNLHFEEKGAFTGEISAVMLKEMGVTHVIVGHSERRQYFAETDETVNKKIKAAMASGLIPIVCVGENRIQREQSITTDLVRMQIKIAFQGIAVPDPSSVIVAYEPIWAIGTGLTATSDQAQEVCAAIRQALSEALSPETAAGIRILYGGSVNAQNAAELFAMPDIDGGLVGGASLKPEFIDIVNYAG